MDSVVTIKSPRPESISEGEDYEELAEESGSSSVSPGSDHQRKFTRFLVDEILKPDFGIHCSGGGFVSTSSRFLSRSEGEEEEEEEEDETSERGGGVTSEHMRRGERLTREGSQSRSVVDSEGSGGGSLNRVWPAWVYCTRYSDRPSSGPRVRKQKKSSKNNSENGKRPRTSFTNDQLKFLKQEFDVNRYLNEERRQKLAKELDLNESQVKIWFQNKRAKAKKGSPVTTTESANNLAVRLMAEGLYNHSVRVSMTRK